MAFMRNESSSFKGFLCSVFLDDASESPFIFQRYHFEQLQLKPLFPHATAGLGLLGSTLLRSMPRDGSFLRFLGMHGLGCRF